MCVYKLLVYSNACCLYTQVTYRAYTNTSKCTYTHICETHHYVCICTNMCVYKLLVYSNTCCLYTHTYTNTSKCTYTRIRETHHYVCIRVKMRVYKLLVYSITVVCIRASRHSVDTQKNMFTNFGTVCIHA